MSGIFPPYHAASKQGRLPASVSRKASGTILYRVYIYIYTDIYTHTHTHVYIHISYLCYMNIDTCYIHNIIDIHIYIYRDMCVYVVSRILAL